MPNKKKGQDHSVVVDSSLFADLVAQVADLSVAVQSLQQSNQQGVNQSSTQAGLATTLAEMVNKVATSSSRDTDINAEEAMKSYSPMWGLKANILFAQEFDRLAVANNQSAQILQNAISQSNVLLQETANAVGRRLILGDKLVANAIGQPGYFHENAPAAQDTPGEGSDE